MSGSNKSGKGIKIVIAIIIIVLLLSPMLIIYGVTSTIENFIRGVVGAVVDAATNFIEDIKSLFGVSIIKNGMYIYPLKSEEVANLREQIEAQGIRTNEAGITEVMLRKMILTQAVTSFTKDTLCVAQIDENEILQNTGYTDINEYLQTLTNKNSKDVWPIDDYNYNLYYISDKFFYFKDSDNMMGNGTEQYYLGLIGSIKIKTSEGDTMHYVSKGEFEQAENSFKELDNAKKEDENNQVRKDLLLKYTINDNGEIVVHKIVRNSDNYKYTFKNANSGTDIAEEGEQNSTYEVLTVPLNIEDNIDTSKYTISVEFLIDLLNMSSSPEYVNEFIDYALEESKITIRAYLVEDKEKSYEKNTYKIKDNFIYELYDIVDLADVGSDNMKTYKELIYDRIYEGQYFDYSVINIPGFENIDYDTAALVKLIDLVTDFLGIEREELRQWFAENVYKAPEDEEEYDEATKRRKIKEYVNSIDIVGVVSEKTKDNFADYILGADIVSVNKISSYLLAAYESDGFSLGEALVEEIKVYEKAETSWEFHISSMSTWYGKITYDDPTESKKYFIGDSDVTAEEYANFNQNSLTEYTDIPGEETKTNIYIYSGRAEEVGITSANPNVILVDNADIYDEILNEDIRRRRRN